MSTVVKITLDKSDLRVCKTEAIIFTSNKYSLLPQYVFTRTVTKSIQHSIFEILDSLHNRKKLGASRFIFEKRKHRNIEFVDTNSSGFRIIC